MYRPPNDTLRIKPAILRYRKYPEDDVINYKHEHVMLFYPFEREVYILDGDKFLAIFDKHYVAIKHEQMKYTHNIDIQELYRTSEKIIEEEANLREAAQRAEERSLLPDGSVTRRLLDTADNADILQDCDIA